jgi:hypothetical protein
LLKGGTSHSLSSELAKINSETLNLAVVTYDFDADMFAENVDTEHHVEKDDETARSESNAGNMQPLVHIGDEGNEANVLSSVVILCDVPTSSCID